MGTVPANWEILGNCKNGTVLKILINYHQFSFVNLLDTMENNTNYFWKCLKKIMKKLTCKMFFVDNMKLDKNRLKNKHK